MARTSSETSKEDIVVWRRLVNEYLEAFAARDIPRCLALFDADAVIDFQMSSFNGREEIADWHADRFAANLRVLQVERVRVNGDTVQVDAIVASDRLAAWRIASLRARATLRFVGGRIVSVVLAPRLNPMGAYG